jgi:hypothetical protein
MKCTNKSKPLKRLKPELMRRISRRVTAGMRRPLRESVV